MGQALPGVLARSAARQVYRLLRLSAPLLRPLNQHIGIEQRARMATALVWVGWNGAAVTSPLGKDSEIVAPERPTAGVACIGHPTAESGVGESLARHGAGAASGRRAVHAALPRHLHHGAAGRSEPGRPRDPASRRPCQSSL
jgi:hypothetical protein